MTSQLTAQTPAPPLNPRPDAPAAGGVSPPLPALNPAPRLVSLDAYRGFIMLLMVSGGLGLMALSKKFPDRPWLQFLGFHSDHVPWIGCAFWDLIQPSFMFMVGVALPFSYASRLARGDSDRSIVLHALWRSLLLVLLGVFLSSNWQNPDRGQHTNWVFPNVLCQIGLGYPFLFLLRGRGLLVQLLALVGILAGTTLAFGLYPAPGPDFDRAAVGLPSDWPLLEGWFAHWNKNANVAHAFDVWFLNLFPRHEPFVYNSGGYATLNFVPSIATMLMGLMAGEMLRRESSTRRQLLWLILAGVVCLGVGLVMAETVSPLVKRIWTPSWAVYSTGWTFLMLAVFHFLIEGQGWKAWAFPFVVVGMNSIAIYVMAQLLKPWIVHTLKVHVSTDLFSGTYAPLTQNLALVVVLWLVCFWMYRRKLFLKI